MYTYSLSPVKRLCCSVYGTALKPHFYASRKVLEVFLLVMRQILNPTLSEIRRLLKLQSCQIQNFSFDQALQV